ncbi:MAG: hypothetical protein KatS3mg053_0238 [Candidatus Roseilinea sp.]|nr:MAG: hypothetical protein KatS3mg053_0238 [Candidatus Roseilinea sp.]
MRDCSKPGAVLAKRVLSPFSPCLSSQQCSQVCTSFFPCQLNTVSRTRFLTTLWTFTAAPQRFLLDTTPLTAYALHCKVIFNKVCFAVEGRWEWNPRKTTPALSYAFFPFLSVLGILLSLTVLRLAGLMPPVLGTWDAGVFPVIV